MHFHCHVFLSSLPLFCKFLLLMWFFSEKVLVPGNVHNAFLDNLIPDTPYSIDVKAVYVDGDGPPVDGGGKTRKHERNISSDERLDEKSTDQLTQHVVFPLQCLVLVPETCVCSMPPPAP